MANKVILSFEFSFEGDGTSDSVAINMLTGPVFFQAPSTQYPILSSTLAITGSIDNADLVVYSGLTISTSSFSLGILTVNFTTAAASGTTYIVAGVIEF